MGVEVRQTERFVRWLADLRDLRARAKVLARIERLIGGNPGDVKSVGYGGITPENIHGSVDTGDAVGAEVL